MSMNINKECSLVKDSKVSIMLDDIIADMISKQKT